MQVDCRIERITYFNDENAYTVMKVTNELNSFAAIGVFPDCTTIGTKKAVGLEVSMEGNWVNHKKYGKQFKFSNIRLKNTGLLFFLSNIVKGLGSSLSKKLVDHYGEEKLTDIIENNPEQLTEFKGIKEKKLKKIVDSWNKYKQLKKLSDFFAEKNANITSNMLLRIYKHFNDKGKDPVETIKNNPYSLTEIRGVGFKTADKIALQLNIDEYSPLRIKALIDYILFSEASDNGHTFLTLKQVNNTAIEYVYNEEGELSESDLKQLIKNVLEQEDNYFFESDIVALNMYRHKEEYIRSFMSRKLDTPSPYIIKEDKAKEFIIQQEKNLGFGLSKEQYNAVFDLCTKGYSAFILCGYAGTGKSTISKIILNFYARFIPKEEITACAFTGMASKRIKDVTGYNSSTIHSLLGYSGGGFEHNQDNPLKHKVILLDEASMVNVDIFYSLTKALHKDTVFIMVGDDAQLPPIGAGNVFVDLLKYNIPKVKLTEIHRQSKDSVLTYFASYMRKGEVPYGYEGNYSDWEFRKKDISNYFAMKKELSDKELKEVRDNHYKDMLNDLYDRIYDVIVQRKISGLYKIWDIQIISPMRNTPLGTTNLNNVLQDRLNDLGGKQIVIRGFMLKQYDKVIHLKNQNMNALSREQFKEKDFDNTSKIRVYNGNLGLVMDINEENEEFYVLYPDNDKVVIYSFDDYKNNIDLGYALTIHKVQGNQFKYVFMPIINSFFIMLNSKLIYTAITRAVEKVFILAQDYAFKHACKNVKETARQTFLSQNLLK